jgi:serine protease Do
MNGKHCNSFVRASCSPRCHNVCACALFLLTLAWFVLEAQCQYARPADEKFDQILKGIEPSIVLLTVKKGEGESITTVLGSGAIYSSEGHIVTNAHLVKDSNHVEVTLKNQGLFKAEFVGTDSETDTAVVRINATGLAVPQWGDSDVLQVGNRVVAMGNPFGKDRLVEGRIVTISRSEFIQTDAIMHGNGFLVDVSGKIIGLIACVQKKNNVQISSFAVPSNVAKNAANAIIRYGKVRRASVGLNMQNMTEGLAKSFGRPDTKGVLISGAAPGSPAEKAGVQSGDIIFEFNGQEISSAEQLKKMVNVENPGSLIYLTLFRKGQILQIQIVAGERDS